ncbi:GNAT family N-acetyltransferase [Streptomyces sp. NPDC058195]|uniref:GNAT family N-acetyltransferase n=1 Tax=Streptomyces sp. NPDC058195 TaxID=3346375 RepID=UPI0036EB49F7
MTSLWTGKRIRLRGIEPDDWTVFMRLAEEEAGMGDLPRPPRSAEHHRARTRQQAAAPSDGDCFQLAIEAVETGEMVGAIGSFHADPRSGRFEYGVTIGAGHRRCGYAAEAVRLLLRHMFEERRFRKCQARILAYNTASLSLHRRLGFVEEGRLREHVFVAGRYQDLVLMSTFAEEFARPRLPDGC